MSKPKFIQILSHDKTLFALDDEGLVWRRGEAKWYDQEDWTSHSRHPRAYEEEEDA